MGDESEADDAREDFQRGIDAAEEYRVRHLRAAGVDVDGFGNVDWYEGCVDADDFMAADRAKAQVEMIAVARIWCRRLQDTTTWTDAKGNRHAINQMRHEHRGNVIRWLRKRASNLHYLITTFGPQPPPEWTALGATQDDPLYKWICTTPVYIALVTAQVAASQRMAAEAGVEAKAMSSLGGRGFETTERG